MKALDFNLIAADAILLLASNEVAKTPLHAWSEYTLSQVCDAQETLRHARLYLSGNPFGTTN